MVTRYAHRQRSCTTAVEDQGGYETLDRIREKVWRARRALVKAALTTFTGDTVASVGAIAKPGIIAHLREESDEETRIVLSPNKVITLAHPCSTTSSTADAVFYPLPALARKNHVVLPYAVSEGGACACDCAAANRNPGKATSLCDLPIEGKE